MGQLGTVRDNGDFRDFGDFRDNGDGNFQFSIFNFSCFRDSNSSCLVRKMLSPIRHSENHHLLENDLGLRQMLELYQIEIRVRYVICMSSITYLVGIPPLIIQTVSPTFSCVSIVIAVLFNYLVYLCANY